MDPVRQRTAALACLKDHDVPRLAREPMLYRLAWRLGLALTPPHFGRFLPNLLMATLPCTAAAAVVFTALARVSERFDADGVPVVSLAVGVYLGAAMAAYYAFSRRDLRLPSWSAFEAADDEGDDGDDRVSDGGPAARPAPAPRRAAPAPAASRQPPRR